MSTARERVREEALTEWRALRSVLLKGALAGETALDVARRLSRRKCNQREREHAQLQHLLEWTRRVIPTKGEGEDERETHEEALCRVLNEHDALKREQSGRADLPRWPIGSWLVRDASRVQSGRDGEWLRPRVCRVAEVTRNPANAHRYMLELFTGDDDWSVPHAPLEQEVKVFWYDDQLFAPVRDALLALRIRLTEKTREAKEARDAVERREKEGRDLIFAIGEALRVGPILEGR